MRRSAESNSSSGIRDNHKRGSVGEYLKAKIKHGSALSFVSAYFTIYAYDALKAQLNGIDHLRFLFGEPSFLKAMDPDRTETKAFAIGCTLDRAKLVLLHAELLLSLHRIDDALALAT